MKLQGLKDSALKRIGRTVRAQETEKRGPEIIANLGDEDFITFGGLLIVGPENDPEGWYVENDMDYNTDIESEYEATWMLYRFGIEKFKEVDGYIVPDAYEEDWPHPLPDYNQWFAKDILSIASFIGMEPEELVGMITSDDPVERGLFYEALIHYWGPDNVDSYPLQLNYKEIHEMLGDEYDEDWDRPEEDEEEEDE